MIPAHHPSRESRKCIFCGCGEPVTTFRHKAHAVPDFLGNQSLFSPNECDQCNGHLANEFEDHLAKGLLPLRSIAQIRGGKGVPTHKDSTGGIRMEKTAAGFKHTVDNADVRSQLEIQLNRPGPIELKLPPTPSQTFIPIRAGMALCKIVCSACPQKELSQIQPAIDWLMNRKQIGRIGFPVLFGFTPGRNPHGAGRLTLLRRKTDIEAPYIWCIIATANFRFQFFLPFCPADGWFWQAQKKRITLWYLPERFEDNQNFGPPEIGVWNFSETQPCAAHYEFSLEVGRPEHP